MDRIQIRGGAKLNGVIPISGAKNAALPLMIASLLTDQTLTLENLPRLADVSQLARILGNHGVDYSIDGKRSARRPVAGQTAHLRARTIVDTTAPYELVSRDAGELLGHRASARAHGGSARLAAGRLRDRHAPGRSPLDGAREARRDHRYRRRLRGRESAEGARRRRDRIPESDGRRHPCRADGGGDRARLDADRATPRASRKSPISPTASTRWARAFAAREPPTIEIQGVARLNGAHHRVLPDRIEAGTYADRRRHDRRRHPARGHRRGCSSSGARGARAGGRDDLGDNRGVQDHAQRRGHRRRRCRDRALPRASRPTCRRSSWR